MSDPVHITRPDFEVTDVVGASAIVGLSVPALNTLRSRGGGPPFVQLGEDRPKIVYRLEDLRSWRDARLVIPGQAALDAGPPRQ